MFTLKFFQIKKKSHGFIPGEYEGGVIRSNFSIPINPEPGAFRGVGHHHGE